LKRPSTAVAHRALIASAVVLIALVGAPIASGHAILEETSPGNDSVLQQSPPAVLLRFNEAVETAFGSIRVYDCSAKRVDSGQITRPADRIVSITVNPQLPRGTYTVTWRVISADSHPVSGAFVFHVKSPGACPAGIAQQVLGKGTPGSISALFKFARGLDFALLLLVVGGSAVLALVLRSAAPTLRRRLYGTVAGLGVGLVLAAILCIVLQGAVAGGFGLSEAFRWNTVHAVLRTRFGGAFEYQLAFAVAAAVVAFGASRFRPDVLGPLTILPAVSLIPTLSAAGHARTSGTLAFAADVTHVAAASAWVGGLAFTVLALLLAGEDRWPLAARAVPRFSMLAVVSVAVLITAGVIRGIEEVRPWPGLHAAVSNLSGWRGLWDTTYGLLLLAKIGLVLPLLALGAYNNRFAVPRLRRQIASLVERRRFLRAAGAELVIMASIVGVTAVLVSQPPAKASVAAGPFAKTFPIGNLEVNFVVDPAKTGPNVMHLYFSTPSGLQAGVADAKISASLPSKSIGPLRFNLQKIVPSHYTMSGAVFPLPGDWQLTIEARRGQFQSLQTTVSVPIRKG